MDTEIIYALTFGLGYLFGSIPFGLILTKLFLRQDIRDIGSGNIGATNVLRTGNKAIAFFTLLLDGLKVPISIFIYLNTIWPFIYLQNSCFILESGREFCGGAMSIPWDLVFVVALGGILGHCFPIWLKFKGGKGVATTLGTFLFIVPEAGFTACFIWLLSTFAFRMSSLSALIAIATLPLSIYFFSDGLYYLHIDMNDENVKILSITVLIVMLIFYRHKDNIQRILKGTEPKIGAKKKTETTGTH